MKVRIPPLAIICALVFGLIESATEVQAAKRKRIKIGVLVSLTASWSPRGKNTVAALHIAAADLKNIRPQYRPPRFPFLVRDTQLDPEKALDAIQALHERGVKIIIGPQSSAEVAMIKS